MHFPTDWLEVPVLAVRAETHQEDSNFEDGPEKSPEEKALISSAP